MLNEIYENFCEKTKRVSEMEFTDGKYDLTKKYKFNYEKLNQDPRLKELTFHRTWMDKLIGLDGCNVLVIDEDSGVIDDEDKRAYHIARNWCDEV